jgi:SPP1 gp7 family putative phage head morphogenesis protein
MRFDLTTLLRRAKNPRRRQVVLRPIVPTAVQAADLYRAAYRPVIEAWRVAVERIAARYEVALPVRDGATHNALSSDFELHDSIFDLDSILEAIGDELQRLVLTLTPSLREWSLRMEGWQRGKWRGAVLTATSIDIGTLLGPEDVAETVQGFMSGNVALLRSVSDQTRTRVSEIVLRGYQARTPAREVAKEMAEAVEISRKRALRIAADQSNKLAARLDHARQEQAGIDRFKWRHSRKRHPRAEHVRHDGVVYAWDDLPLLEGRPDRPGDAPFCGCRAQAVIDLS